MAKPLSELGEYEQNAVRTVTRAGYAVVEKATEVPGCWVVWNWDVSYRQGDARVFSTELDALRWAHGEEAHHAVTFVPWGSSPHEVVSEKGSSTRTESGDAQ